VETEKPRIEVMRVELVRGKLRRRKRAKCECDCGKSYSV